MTNTITPPHPRSPVLSRRSLLTLLSAVPATAALSLPLPGAFSRQGGNRPAQRLFVAGLFLDGRSRRLCQKTGVTPNIATYDSNETLFAKLNSPAAAGFDIVIPSSSWIKQLADKGLLQSSTTAAQQRLARPGPPQPRLRPGQQIFHPEGLGFARCGLRPRGRSVRNRDLGRLLKPSPSPRSPARSVSPIPGGKRSARSSGSKARTGTPRHRMRSAPPARRSRRWRNT